MKVLCIKQFYPQDDCGYGPNKYSFAFTDKHCYYVGQYKDWEDGNSLESDDFEVDDDIYRYCLEKAIQYISDKKTKKSYGEYDEYAFFAGWLELSEEELDKLNLSKESSVIDFVKNNIPNSFNVFCEKKNIIIKDCLSYLVYDFDSGIAFDRYSDIEKSVLKEKLQEYMATDTKK